MKDYTGKEEKRMRHVLARLSPHAQLRVRAAANELIGQMVATKVAAMKRPTRRPPSGAEPASDSQGDAENAE